MDVHHEDRDGLRVVGGLVVIGEMAPHPELVATIQHREQHPETPVRWEDVKQDLGL